MTQGFLAADEFRTNARPASYGSDPALARQSGSSLNTLEPEIPLTEQAHPEPRIDSAIPATRCAVLPYHHVFRANERVNT